MMRCRVPGAFSSPLGGPACHLAVTRAQLPLSQPFLPAEQPSGARGGRGGRTAPPPQGTTLLSLPAYDSWCGVAHGCTRKIGLKICGKCGRAPRVAPAPPGRPRPRFSSPPALPRAPPAGPCPPGPSPLPSGRPGGCALRALRAREALDPPGRKSGGRGAVRRLSLSEIFQPYLTRKYGSPGEKRLTRALLKSNSSACCAGKIALAASQRAGTRNAEGKQMHNQIATL